MPPIICYSLFFMLSIIAAIGKNRELGKNNALLWNIPEDMRYFRDTTRGHPVIMGQRTFESIGRPLPNRTNIVLTQDPHFSPEGVIAAHSPEEAIKMGKRYFFFSSLRKREGGSEERRSLDLKNPLCPKTDISPSTRGGDEEKEIFIIGGALIYSLFLKRCDRLYLTLVDAEFPDADVFFSEYREMFREISRRESSDENFQYAFTVWEKGRSL